MYTNIQVKVERLNLLYHRIITKHFIEEHQELFKSLIQQLKVWGYVFKPCDPVIDLTPYDNFNELETRLYELLELILMARRYGEINQLNNFTNAMRNCELSLVREIYISLCRRGVIKNGYFKTDGTSNKIDFVQSGNWIDSYVLL